jgi:hypothetical protein
MAYSYLSFVFFDSCGVFSLLQFFQLSIFFTWSISGFTKGDLIRSMGYIWSVEACRMARRYELYCMYTFNICIQYYYQIVVPFEPQGDRTFNSYLQLCLYIFVSITAPHVTAHNIYGRYYCSACYCAQHIWQAHRALPYWS